MNKTKIEQLEERLREWEALAEKMQKEMDRDVQGMNYARAFYTQIKLEFLQERIVEIKVILFL